MSGWIQAAMQQNTIMLFFLSKKETYLFSFTACYGPHFDHREKKRPLLDKLSGPIAIGRAQKSLSMKFKDNLKLLH